MWFVAYAEYWIKQPVQRYLEKCGSMVRIPNHARQRIGRYKKTVQESEQELGSLDTPLADDNSLTLADIIQTDFGLEDETIENVCEHSKSELWSIVEPYFVQFEVLQEIRRTKKFL